MQFDVIILGGGPAGYHAALQSAQKGLTTALIETSFIGGTCLKEGCIPTKILLKSAEVYHATSNAATFGVTVSDVQYNHKSVLTKKNNIITQLNKGVIAKLKKAKVTLVEGFGTIKSKQNGTFQIECQQQLYSAKHIIISTGSSVFIPPIQGIEAAITNGFVLDSAKLLQLEQLPTKLVIIGGGVIGIEMAELFSKLGVEVEVIEAQKTIGGTVDETMATTLEAMLTSQHITIHTEAKVTVIEAGVVHYTKKGQQYQITADKALICTGRKGNAQNFGLENIAVETNRGFIVTNDRCATNVPNVYAIGDVNGKSMLAHTGYREAEVAVDNISGEASYMNYDAIPNVIYTAPEMAAVGLTEQELRTQGITYKAISVPMYYSGRFLIEESYEGCFIKVLIDERLKTILGVHILAPFASEIIFGMTILVEQQLPLAQIKRIVKAHPSIAEILSEVINQYEIEVGLK